MYLLVDWRFGGMHFEEVLLDYDVAMNYGNWTFCVHVDSAYTHGPLGRYTAKDWRDPTHWIELFEKGSLCQCGPSFLAHPRQKHLSAYV